MDNPLTEGDLASLFADYYQYRSKWKFIGNALGIKVGDLQAINQTYHGDCDECFREILITWLKQEEPEVKTEGQLRQAAEKSLSPLSALTTAEKTNRRLWISATLVPVILVLLAWSSYFRPSPSQILREKYQNQPLMEFSLLNFTTPFLNVTMIETSRHSTSLTLSEFIIQIGDEKRTLITGHPGAGKTTLMRYLAREWAEERALLSCQILFLIHLDTLSKEHKPKPLSLSDLLDMSSHKDVGDVTEMSKEIQNSHGAGVCFLLDAYDQWHWKGDFVYNLFFRNELHDSVCILASRPNFYQERVGISVIEIIGFRQTDLEQFLHSMTTDEAVIRSVSDLWSADPNVKELCRLPLNMVMVVSLAKDNRHLSVHTKTQIYLAFMKVTVKHFQNQHHDDLDALALTKCIMNKADDELCAAFQHLHQAAYEMHFRGRQKFPEDHKIKRNLNKLGFISITKADTGLDKVDTVKYKFFHPTFMEFFAAIHLLSLSQGDRLSLYIKEQSESQVHHDLSPVWLFFFGLVGELYQDHEEFFPNNISDIIRQLSIFYHEQEIEQSPPYCQNGRFLEYIKEIQWKEKKLSKLLSLAGIVVNSALFILCGDKPCSSFDSFVCGNEQYMSFNSLLYIVNNADIHTLRFDDLGGTNCEIDALPMLQASMLVLVQNLLDVLPVNKSEYVKAILPLIFNSILSLQDNSTSEINQWLVELGESAMNLSDEINTTSQNVSMETYVNLSQNIPLLMQSMSEVVSDQYNVALQSQNNASENLFTIMDNIATLVADNTIANWVEKCLLEIDNMFEMYSVVLPQLYVSDGFSVYIHMTLQEQTDPHDRTIKWLNAKNIVDYTFSGNILSHILWEFVDARSIVEQIIFAFLKFQHSFETEAKSMLLETFESIFLTTAELWESVKSLLSHLRSVRLKNVELSCDDFMKLVKRLERNKNIIYAFDLKIDLGTIMQNVSSSCHDLVLTLNTVVGRNINLQKLTVIFPTEYFMNRHNEFIPHKLRLSGLKHLCFVLPKSVKKWQCSKFIREVNGFNRSAALTLEIQGCPLNLSKTITLLPHTLQGLTLAQSNLTDEDANTLVELVNSMNKLTSLSLPNNFITGNGLKDLVGALIAHEEFTSLDLSSNLIKKNNGLGSFSHLRNLRELKLSNCSMGNAEIEELVSALESNLNLRSLNLSGNPFIGTEHGLAPLAWLTNLQYLDISNRLHFDVDGYCEGTLIKVLKSLTQLRFLNLCSKTDPPIYWSRDMAAAISSLPHLQVFNAPCLRLRED